MHTVHIEFFQPFFGAPSAVFKADSMKQAKNMLAQARRNGVTLEPFTSEKGEYICDVLIAPGDIVRSFIVEDIPF